VLQKVYNLEMEIEYRKRKEHGLYINIKLNWNKFNKPILFLSSTELGDSMGNIELL
jgi:hypothetical protein